MFDEEFDDSIIGGGYIHELIDRYEQMLHADEVAFFEEKELEQIIEYYEERHQVEKAFQATDHALSQHPFSAYFMLKKAQFHFDRKEDALAFELLEKAEIYDATDPEIFFLRADIYTSQGDFEKAIKTLNDALEILDEDE